MLAKNSRPCYRLLGWEGAQALPFSLPGSIQLLHSLKQSSADQSPTSFSCLAKLQCLFLPILNWPARPSNNRKAGQAGHKLLLKISRWEKSKDRARQCSDTVTSHLGGKGQWCWALPNAPFINKSGATPFLWEGKNEKGKTAQKMCSNTAPTWGRDDKPLNTQQARKEDTGATGECTYFDVTELYIWKW